MIPARTNSKHQNASMALLNISKLSQPNSLQPESEGKEQDQLKFECIRYPIFFTVDIGNSKGQHNIEEKGQSAERYEVCKR